MFPLARTVPLMGEGVRGLTVAVVRVAVEIIPNDGDFGSWLMPEEQRRAMGEGSERREDGRERKRERERFKCDHLHSNLHSSHRKQKGLTNPEI